MIEGAAPVVPTSPVSQHTKIHVGVSLLTKAPVHPIEMVRVRHGLREQCGSPPRSLPQVAILCGADHSGIRLLAHPLLVLLAHFFRTFFQHQVHHQGNHQRHQEVDGAVANQRGEQAAF